MSRTYTSPPVPSEPERMMSCTASGIVMKYRVIRRSVTVTGPPRAIWRRKIGTTEPDEPRTLPKRTVAKRVTGKRCASASTANSASAFDAPMTVAGETALSVETWTKCLTAFWPAMRAMIRVAIALLRTASTGLPSMRPTCL